MIKFSPSHLGEEVFFSLLISIQSTVSVVAEFRLYLEKFSISPLQAYSFCCWFFQQLHSILLCKCAFQGLLWQKLSFSSPSLYPNGLASILSLRRQCVVNFIKYHPIFSSSCSIPSIYSRSAAKIISFLFILISFQPEWVQFLLVHCAQLCNLQC